MTTNDKPIPSSQSPRRREASREPIWSVPQGRAPTIALWGHYHGRNLGDELVVGVLIQAIRSRLPTARIIGISMIPEATTARHGITALPLNPRAAHASARHSEGPSAAGVERDRATIAGRARVVVASLPGARRLNAARWGARRWMMEIPFSLRARRQLGRIDLVVVAGSGQLLDEWNGARGHPYTTFRWATLARLAHVPVVYASVGAGPIESSWSRRMLGTAVEAAAAITVRDENSASVLARIGVRRALPICPDMAYAYEPRPRVQRGERRVADRPTIAVNVMAHQDPDYWPRGDPRRHERYLDRMAAVMRGLLDRGYAVRLFSSQGTADRSPTDAVVRRLRVLSRDGEIPPTYSIEKLEDEHALADFLRECDAVVAGRFHPILLALQLGVPAIGLAYNPKTFELLAAADLEAFCLDIDSFSPESLLAVVDTALTTWKRDHADRVSRHVKDCQRRVNAQFDSLFGPPAAASETADQMPSGRTRR